MKAITPLMLNGRGHKKEKKPVGGYGINHFGKKCKGCRVRRPRVKGYCRNCYYKGKLRDKKIQEFLEADKDG